MASSRRLSAIMFTDVVGFTSRTQTDERGSLALLEEEETLVRPILETHRGRTVKSTGDGLLVEFPSALQATECAVEIQTKLRERNRSAAGDPVELRIGIHLGDVEERAGDILGDAVNIAARVQPEAPAGGVAVSQQVFDQVRNKVALRFESLGSRTLKGVQRNLAVYRIVLPWETGRPEAEGSGGRANRLAVLPFANISPDPRDAYLSDGLTEEIISVLSELGGLRLIARTSVEAYKASPKPIPQVGEELEVGWVLEGSVRRSGNRLRIAVQLIEVRTQAHVWAATYDRQLDDVFALQSEMAQKVAETLRIKLLAGEQDRLTRRSPPNPGSYLEYLQGRTALHGITEAGLREAKSHFERAIALDERNAAAHAGLADAHLLLGLMYHHLPRDEYRAAARRHVLRAIELDPDLAEAHTSLALDYGGDDNYRAAEEEFRRAIALNPSYAGAHLWYSQLLAEQNRVEEALRESVLAEQLDPLSALVLADRASLLGRMGDLVACEATLRRLAEVEHEGILYWDGRASVALIRGDRAEFDRCIRRLEDQLPGRPELAVAQALSAAWSGDVTRARELLGPVELLPSAVRPDNQIALAYAYVPDLDSCFRWLEIAQENRRLPMRFWRQDPSPQAASVRNDPRFERLLRRAGLDTTAK